MNKEELDKHRRMLIELNKELQQENKQLKEDIKTFKFTIKTQQQMIDELINKIDKTIEYLKTFHFIDNIRVLDVKEYEKLLEILGDKEQEEYRLTPDENGTKQINGEWYKVEKIK